MTVWCSRFIVAELGDFLPDKELNYNFVPVENQKKIIQNVEFSLTPYSLVLFFSPWVFGTLSAS